MSHTRSRWDFSRTYSHSKSRKNMNQSNNFTPGEIGCPWIMLYIWLISARKSNINLCCSSNIKNLEIQSGFGSIVPVYTWIYLKKENRFRLFENWNETNAWCYFLPSKEKIAIGQIDFSRKWPLESGFLSTPTDTR